jgi:hypothetical protein
VQCELVGIGTIDGRIVLSLPLVCLLTPLISHFLCSLG